MSRYIDADKLDANLLAGGLLCAATGLQRKRKITIGEIRGILQRAPTADVREVKRGKWIDVDTVDGGYQTCSCCKQDVEPNLDGVFFEYPFCPYCGAEMLEEDE